MFRMGVLIFKSAQEENWKKMESEISSVFKNLFSEFDNRFSSSNSYNTKKAYFINFFFNFQEKAIYGEEYNFESVSPFSIINSFLTTAVSVLRGESQDKTQNYINFFTLSVEELQKISFLKEFFNKIKKKDSFTNVRQQKNGESVNKVKIIRKYSEILFISAL
jgi:hypothetical protein